MIPNATTVKIGEDLEVQTAAEAPSRTYKIDFDAGRVGGFCDETEAMKQAIYKILQTERFAYLIYSWNYGIELDAVVGKSYQVFASEIKRVITEALLADSRITDVTDFEVSQIDKRTATVKFTAETIFGEIPIETFENIMDRCLSRVAASIDKREGSVVYDAIAPAAAELAIMYIELAYLMDRAFPDTEEGDDLTRKCQERSVFRTTAKAAIRKRYLEDGDGGAMDVPIGSHYSGDALNYVVTEKIATGQFKLLCETAGAAGNQYQGTLFPIDYVEGLGAARLADILINGEDEESDADLLARYKASLEAQAYGGNIADYRAKVELLQGVGAVKVIPVWNGGGTVKIVFVDSDWSVPSSTLVDTVQTAVDPTQNQGEGVGIAPIGHVVTVTGVTGTKINVSFKLTFAAGYTWDTVKTGVTKAVNDYFAALAKDWANQSGITVRVSQVETKVLSVDGVIDITGTKINGGTQNIALASDAIPVMGGITNEA